jgi:hypothetical protein
MVPIAAAIMLPEPTPAPMARTQVASRHGRTLPPAAAELLQIIIADLKDPRSRRVDPLAHRKPGLLGLGQGAPLVVDILPDYSYRLTPPNRRGGRHPSR